jgi:hypothetical protein
MASSTETERMEPWKASSMGIEWGEQRRETWTIASPKVSEWVSWTEQQEELWGSWMMA